MVNGEWENDFLHTVCYLPFTIHGFIKSVLKISATRGRARPMKQILQNNKTGRMAVADVPAPIAQRGRVLVRAAASLISAGTEKAFVELGRKSLLGKAKERPDLVGKVIEKVKSEGLLSTLQSVREKLDESHALGR